MQEKRVAMLIKQFQAESAQLSRQTILLAQVIRELDSGSGNMTLNFRKSVGTVLNQVEQAVLGQRKPTINALSQVV